MVLAPLTLLAQSAVSTVAGSGSAGSANGTGTAASFQFGTPSAAAVNTSGTIYVADPGNHVIRQITGAGVVTTFAGGMGVSGSTNDTGTAARFSGPRGVAVDGAGNLYVADTANHTIRMITPAGVVTTLAGSVGTSGTADGTGAAARFTSPIGIAADRAGAGGAAVNVFVADSQNHTIRQVVVATGAVTTLAGTAGASALTNGVGAAARFNVPTAIASNTAGTTLFVADRANHVIRQVAVAGGTGTVTTLAGSGTSGSADGTGAAASFNLPTGLALDTAGTSLIVTDTFNHTIRSVTTATGAVTTLAGSAGNSGNTNGLSSVARFNFPSGVGVGTAGTYVVDATNQLVRLLAPAVAPTIVTNPTAKSVVVAGSTTFTVVAVGNPTVSYQWMIQPGGSGSFSNLSNAGAYSGVTTDTLTVSNVTAGMNGDRFQVVVSNGVTPNATSSAAALTVTQVPVFTSAASNSFVVGQTTNFQVAASGSPAPTFSVAGLPGSGWLSFNTTTGVLSGAPSPGDANATITLTATNSAGTVNQSFTASVVTTTPPVLVGPTNQSVGSGGTTATFSVTATGTPSTFTYQWERRPAGGATFAAIANGTVDGLTFAGATTNSLAIVGVNPNMNGDAYRVVVTSTGGTTTSSAATLAVAPTITNANTITFVTGQNNSFNFAASGNPTPTVSATVNGTLPAGLTLVNSNTGVSGTPTDAVSSTTFITVSATNTGGTAQQTFTLLVSPPQSPTITSAASTTFNINQAGSFTMTATGSPTPTFQLLGSLPSGVSFNTSTGVLSGTPTVTTGSPFSLTLQATNSAGTATQTFTLTVQGIAPTISTHPSNATAGIGQNVSFSAAATGTPTPSLRWQRQPSGTTGFVNLSDDGVYSGTATNTLTITGVTAGMSLDQFRLVANNGTSPEATSNAATLTINLGTVISTIAGQVGFIGGIDGSGTSARFNFPANLATDSSGNLYIADTANHTIRKMTSSGIVSTLAGLGGFSGSADGTTSEARFNSPQGVAVDGAGNVYVADTFNHAIRLISPSGTVSTIAGSAGANGAVDGTGTSARFFAPTALAVDFSGAIYVADSSNHAIRRISTAREVTTVAGVMGSSGFADGTGSTARFASPSGIAVDSSGTVYISDSLNQVVRRMTSLGSVTTLAGLSGNAGIADGVGSNARFNRPTGIAVDGSGNLYIADALSSTVRKLVISTGDVSTLAGLAFNTGSTDGAGLSARFNQAAGITIDSNGTLYVSDTRNHTIRRSGSPIAPTIQTHPVNRVGAVGQAATFTATATGAPLPGYQWQRAAAATPDSFVNLVNDGIYAGVTTATLTISSVTAEMNGDRFRVVANNGVSAATSNPAALSIGTAPVFTSAAAAEFQASRAGSFTVVATSSPAATFSATGLPSWASINASTGEITGTPPDTSGSPFTVVVTASNGIAATQELRLTVLPAVLPPTVTNQPGNLSVGQGQAASFSVTVSGTAPFTYQWRRNGFPINGATASSLALTNVQPAAAGIYSVLVTNAAGSTVSNGATLAVNTLPVITLQPFSQAALAGSTVTFTVAARGSSQLTYQWRRNGGAIAGANSATLVLSNVTANDAANYDVLVGNEFGQVRSSLVQLTLAAGVSAPVIVTHPSSTTVAAGGLATLSAAAIGVPAPSYQWRRNGNVIGGATSPSFSIAGVQASDAASYDVVVSNSSGTVVSSAGVLRVVTRSFAGTYFGAFAGGIGSFALYVRDDNTGVFLGYLPGSVAPVMSTNVVVNDNGSFSFSQAAVAAAAANPGEPARAAALAPVNVNGTIGSDNTLTGAISGGANAALAANRVPDTGTAQGFSGFYQAGAATGAAQSFTIVAPNGQAFGVVTSGNSSDGGLGSASASGQVTVTGARSIISASISGGSVTGTSTGAINASYSGGSDTALALQRLINISSRTRVGTGDAVAIAGFVISGEQSKPVLIRAVGPTLGAAPFNVPGVLASPRIELFRGSTSLAVNSGIGTNRAAIDAAGAQAGAFALGAAGTDAAILTTLAPGNYTAVVSSSTNTAGVALVEVYDLSGASPGQKLLNISTRAAAGTNENTLIAGFVVPPGTSKRVLIRGVGPGLAAFGVTGTLAQPVLSLLNSASATVASNTNWSTSADAAAITAASAQVGGFGLANNDSALIATLAPGNYTAQVLGANNATGVALIEVYELP